MSQTSSTILRVLTSISCALWSAGCGAKGGQPGYLEPVPFVRPRATGDAVGRPRDAAPVPLTSGATLRDAAGAPGVASAASASSGDSGLSGVGVGAALGQTDGGLRSEHLGLRCEADAASPQLIDYARPGPYAVGQLDITFEDKSRPIEATDTHAAAPSRVLVTTVYYPAADAALGTAPLAAGGPFPMIMYSHGFSSSRDEGSTMGKLAASHGYVVVSPDFPLTNLGAPGGAVVGDSANQPGDVSFLIDQMLTLSKDSRHLLSNAVDESRIGASGVSGGGFTTLLVGFHLTLKDDRIKVVAPIAGLSAFFMKEFFHTRELPVLFIHGDLDALVDYKLHARRSFERAAPNAQLMTLANGSHAAFAVQFDAATTMALNFLFAPPNSDPGNPDAFSCGATADVLKNSAQEMTAQLGGRANFVDYDPANEPLIPCSGDQYTRPAMDAKEQVELTARAATAFFDAHLASTPEARRDGCRYLQYELPKNAAVAVE